MDTAVQRVRRLGIDVALTNEAAERRLNLPARTAEAVIEVQMPECGIEIVAPQQADDPAAKPDTLGVRGRAGHQAADFGDFIDTPWHAFAFFAGSGGVLFVPPLFWDPGK